MIYRVLESDGMHPAGCRFIDNKGKGDDYSVVKILIQKYSEHKDRWKVATPRKHGSPVWVFEYANLSTYIVKITKAFETPEEEYEVLESLVNRLSKV